MRFQGVTDELAHEKLQSGVIKSGENPMSPSEDIFQVSTVGLAKVDHLTQLVHSF